jgi:hypothetical protein
VTPCTVRVTNLTPGSERNPYEKVLQDKRFKNRELQIMRVLDHPNVVKLKHCFYSTTVRGGGCTGARGRRIEPRRRRHK